MIDALKVMVLKFQNSGNVRLKLGLDSGNVRLKLGLEFTLKDCEL